MALRTFFPHSTGWAISHPDKRGGDLASFSLQNLCTSLLYLRKLPLGDQKDEAASVSRRTMNATDFFLPNHRVSRKDAMTHAGFANRTKQRPRKRGMNMEAVIAECNFLASRKTLPNIFQNTSSHAILVMLHNCSSCFCNGEAKNPSLELEVETSHDCS